MKNQNLIPIIKRSKKAQKEYNKQNRSVTNFNTGDRVMKTKKRPTRAMWKDAERKNKNY